MIDGLRRIVKVLNEGETISKVAIVAIALAYLTGIVSFLVLCFNNFSGSNLLFETSYVTVIAVVAGNATLATVLYRLGLDQATEANS